MRVRVQMGQQQGGIASKIFATVFLLIFAGAGVAFGVVMLQGMVGSLSAWRFDPTPCLVTTSQLWTKPGEASAGPTAEAEVLYPFSYRFDLTYRYTAGGIERTGDVYKLGYTGTDSLVEVERLVRANPPGTEATCYVDPDDPGRAVFTRSAPWMLLALLFPAIFVAFGVGGIVATWRSGRPRRDAEGRELRSSISKQGAGLQGTGCLVGFFGIFAAFGMAFTVPFFGIPAWHSLQARTWTPMPCTIETSGVGDHGDTYSVEVLYRYEVDGTIYHGERYDFFTGSTSGREGKQEVVDRLAPGSVATCYVDPADPSSAVLERGLTTQLWFSAIPGVFVLVGLVGMGWALVASRRGPKGSAAARWLPGIQGTAAPAPDPARVGDDPSRYGAGGSDRYELPSDGGDGGGAGGGPLVLEPSWTPVGKVIGAIIGAVVVNALVGAISWFAVIKPWREGGEVEGCVALFVIPFALIAIALLVNVPYQILAAFNPRPHLEIDPAPLTLGRDTRLTWRFRGSGSRIHHLKITLTGAEHATYRVGTRSTTVTSTFHRQVMLDTVDPSQILQGEVSGTLPHDTMCSFDANRNKVTWKLELVGEIARWPDVTETFDLAVAPAQGSGRGPRFGSGEPR